VEEFSIEVEPEMPAIVPGKKRKFPLEVRWQIVQYYDTLPNDGSKGAYLRRNGVFDSQISDWRKEAAAEPAATKTVGRKPLTSAEKELRRLRSQNDKLQAELDRANVVIEVQKKVSQLLEMHLDPSGQTS
jgi:transposase